jgi:hypothetical protein
MAIVDFAYRRFPAVAERTEPWNFVLLSAFKQIVFWSLLYYAFAILAPNPT